MRFTGWVEISKNKRKKRAMWVSERCPQHMVFLQQLPYPTWASCVGSSATPTIGESARERGLLRKHHYASSKEQMKHPKGRTEKTENTSLNFPLWYKSTRGVAIC